MDGTDGNSVINKGFPMTRKRRYLISAAVLAACVGIALGVLAMLPPRPGVTKANFDLIEGGMNPENVERLFGRLPVVENPFPSEHEPGLVRVTRIWQGERNSSSIVWFGENGLVKRKQWNPPTSTEPIPDKLRRWLGLPPAE